MEPVDTECAALVELLEGLRTEQWNAPSLCAGWRVRDVVSHLLMPYELTAPRFMAAMVVNRFDFDRVANAWALRDHRTAAELVDALRAHGRFRVPGAGPEAPLTHLVVHGLDITDPLGLTRPLAAKAANVTLDQLMSPRARGVVDTARIDGLSLVATDTGWRHGTGPAVQGSAAALILTVTGRRAAAGELTGDGADLLRTRLVAAATPAM